MNILKIAMVVGGIGLISSCSQDPNDPGLEYAPQMAHSIPFEPFTQVTNKASEFYNTIDVNPGGLNQRMPSPGTIARKHHSGMKQGELATDILVYNIPADSVEYAGKVLKSPFEHNDEVIQEGKVLYGMYCQSCHGAGGLGDGKVADQYKGVANLEVKAKVVSEGYIFHVITHGKGRMWPHGSQVNPDERWKIAHFVKSLGGSQ